MTNSDGSNPRNAVNPAARILAAAGLVVAVLLAFAPALRNGFVWDDNRYVTDNPTFREPYALARIWTDRATWADPVAMPSPYPLSLTLFYFQFRAWESQPAGYHAVSLVLHALNVLLVYFLLVRLRVRAAWLAALLFAVHPVQVETVAWIAEQKNLLSTLAGLLFLHAFLSHLRRGGWLAYGGALVFFMPALLAKTVASTFAATALLVWILERGRGGLSPGVSSWRAIAARIAPFLALGFMFAIITIIWERTQTGATSEAITLTGADRIRIASRVPWFYLLKGFWPMDIMAVYPRWDFADTGAVAWLFLAMTLGLAAFALWGSLVRPRATALCAAHFLASIAPVLGLINFSTMTYTFVADHYQYVAALGWMIPLAWLADGMIARTSRAIPLSRPLLLGLIMGFAAIASNAETRHYRDLESLFRRCIAKNPSAWIARYNLAHALHASGRMDEALAEYSACLTLNSGYAQAHNGVGAIQLQSGDLPAALASFRDALKLDPGFADATMNLISCLVELGSRALESPNPADAEPLLTEALSINPNDVDALLYLGRLRMLQSHPVEALALLERAAALAPDDADVRTELEKARRAAGSAR